LLLTQGRAVGVCVTAAVQDPSKEVVALRNLFSARVGLRVDEATQIDMVLGDGARAQGARCDRIKATTQGVGYVRLDGVREPIRVRAGYVTDEEIRAMAAEYAPRRSLDGEALFLAAEGDAAAEVVELPTAHDYDQTKGKGKNEDERQAS
jgi:S-DNA-T family DNA segregation ATPase FtsK/SpoIIIE